MDNLLSHTFVLFCFLCTLRQTFCISTWCLLRRISSFCFPEFSVPECPCSAFRVLVVSPSAFSSFRVPRSRISSHLLFRVRAVSFSLARRPSDSSRCLFGLAPPLWTVPLLSPFECSVGDLQSNNRVDPGSPAGLTPVTDSLPPLFRQSQPLVLSPSLDSSAR